MTNSNFSIRRGLFGTTGLSAAISSVLLAAGPSQAATTLDGPIDLGTATTFGVLTASTVTNTGASVVTGDIGVSPGTSITGFSGPPDGTLTGGATACNVFWQVGSSATLGDNSFFVGTIMAQQSITAVTSASIEGRLLARTGAVTLDTNQVTVPTGCSGTFGTISTSPVITSAAPSSATVGTPYTHTITATGTPAPTFTVTTGSLPAGLQLDATTGVISGTPTTSGSFTFTVTASNGTAPDATATYTITVASGAEILPATGNNPAGPLNVAPLLIVTGVTVIFFSRLRAKAGRRTA